MKAGLRGTLQRLRLRDRVPPRAWRVAGVGAVNLFAWALLAVYLLPVAYMVVTAFVPTEQLSDRNAPWYPARIRTFAYQGEQYRLYEVPLPGGTRSLAMIAPGTFSSDFLDPQDPAAGTISYTGDWHALQPVYQFHPVLDSFAVLFGAVQFPRMLVSTLLLVLIGEIGVLVSSVLVAYGFARFPLPGGELLFYVLIATILIPDKVTSIPTYFFYINTLDWHGTIFPLVVHLYFGNAVYIFLLRQNFRSLPVELEESAMLDGAGPLRRLWTIVLPQSWPVVITISLLHFFFTWNEARQASLYLSSNAAFMPVSFGVQVYQSRVPIQNVIQASSLLVLILPVIVLFVAQRFFLRGVIVTGLEKRRGL
ncbi:MAG: carbohydrate ABC transporter permease [Anaerolineales bacterium]|nr:carbohydrate ABC transporter permease [Anaerolineales bacterium]